MDNQHWTKTCSTTVLDALSVRGSSVGGMRAGGGAGGGAGGTAPLVAGLRAHSLVGFAHAAEHYRQVWAITRLVHAQEGWRVGDASRADALGCGRITEHDLDVTAAREVAA